MKDTDRILLDGLRSTVAEDVPADQWDMVVKAVEEAGDIRLIDGYAATIVLGAVEKAKKKKNKIQTVMGEFKSGKLESSSGQKVTNPKQAIAIALSEQRRAKKKKKVAKADEPVEVVQESVEADDDMEKGQFASRSEAGRYAANMRWRGSVSQGGRAANEARMAENARRGKGSGNPARGGKTVASKKPFLDLTDVDPQGKLEGKGEAKSSPASYKDHSLSDIASEIRRDLKAQGKKVPPAAKPYLDAMDSLDKITDSYFADSGSSIVAYLLSNLSSYKGETARAIKAELNRRFKEEGANIDRRQAAQDTWARG